MASLVVSLVIAAVITGRPNQAHAQDATVSRTVQQYYERGQTLYEQRKYRQAVRQLRKAYALKPVPMLLYNIALAQWRAGKLADALRVARQARQGVSEDAKPDLDGRIAGLQAVFDAREVADDIHRRSPRPVPPVGRPHDLSTLGWTGAAVAVVGVGLGCGAWYVDHQLDQESTAFKAAARRGRRQEYHRRLADLQDQQLLGRILAVGSLAATATGLTMVIVDLTDDRGDHPGPRAQLTTSPRPGGAQLGLAVSF